MEYVQLKEICSINMGQSPDSKSYNNDGNGMPFYQGNADFGETHPVTRVWCTEPTKIAAALFGGNVVAKFLGLLREPAENYLADNINNMMKANGKQFVSNMVGDGVNTFLDKKVCDMLKGHDEQLAQAVNTVESLYRTVINEHLPKILDSIDISKIVRERINEMDVNETEKLILQVMNKELKAIVWLGALLGMIMGSINLLF